MIDMFASERQYAEHLLPVWRGLPDEARGIAYLPRGMEQAVVALRTEGFAAIRGRPRKGGGPTIVAAAQDEWMLRPSPVAYLEHGAGQAYEGDPRGRQHASYSGGDRHERVRVFLCPNETVAERWRHRYPNVPAVVIGAPPKLDAWFIDGGPRLSGRPIVAVSFHPDLPLLPETTGCWGHYDAVLPDLASRFRLLGHGHPRLWPHLKHRWERLGVEHTPHFDEVLRRASVYIVDNSSTGPEFVAATGRPLIWLNGPRYRRGVHHGGRFWAWVGTLGPAVDEAGQLEAAINRALEQPLSASGLQAREEALDAVFPMRDGKAAQRAAMAVLDAFGG